MNYMVSETLAMVATALSETGNVHLICIHLDGLIQVGVQIRLKMRPEG